jgi:amino acid permease
MYGKFEFAMSIIKVLTMVLLIMLCVVLNIVDSVMKDYP